MSNKKLGAQNRAGAYDENSFMGTIANYQVANAPEVVLS